MFIKGALFSSVTAFSFWALNKVAKSSDIFTSIEAAEVLDPSDNDETKAKKGKFSRRDRFNFVADVVTETGASLVYIKIKDRFFKFAKKLLKSSEIIEIWDFGIYVLNVKCNDLSGVNISLFSIYNQEILSPLLDRYY